MPSPSTEAAAHTTEAASSVRERIERAILAEVRTLTSVERLTPEQQRRIVARYTAVLEGNFIYWMTGAYLAAKGEPAREIIHDNLLEEVRDCHPGMLRRFAMAAHSIPTDLDLLAVSKELMEVRLFIGRLSAVRILAMMAFFEGFIQKFMPYLASLAAAQGSAERQYTDVHGVCDVGHTQALFRALEGEILLDPASATGDLFEGVSLLRNLLKAVIVGARAQEQAA